MIVRLTDNPYINATCPPASGTGKIYSRNDEFFFTVAFASFFMICYGISMKSKQMKIFFEGPLLCGWVYTNSNKCKDPNCRCHTDPSKRHGLYYRWTGRVNGKLLTRSICKQAAEECQRRIDNYKTLMKKIEKLISDEVAKEPWKNMGKGSES